MSYTYNPDIFRVRTIDEAKAIILTAEDIGVEQRWNTETPYLTSLIREQFPSLDADSTVIDYGCGVGRLSKELIAQTGCRVVGVDISPSMRALAAAYVDSDRFLACAPEMFDWLVIGKTFDLAIAVWVLQHCFSPADDIARVRNALCVRGGGFFVVNNNERRVPTKEAVWTDDGLNIRTMLAGSGFDERASGSIAAASSPALAGVTFWASYQRHS